jgi:Tfp pilus assembly protein PilO
MKLQLSSSNRTIVAVVVLAGLAIAFWMLAMSPKRDEASELDAQAKQLKTSLAQHEAEVAEGEAAKKEFSTAYQHLVVVGKAVPGGDETASLLVQMSHISHRAKGKFLNIKLSSSGGGEEAAPASGSEEAPASPTEVAASLLPLGATVGPAGLAVMPYEVTFDGNFFKIANFIKGIDSLVDTKESQVSVDGRLVTINGFGLEAAPGKGFPDLQASFVLTTYLTPPGEGTATGSGTTPETAAPAEATPAAATIGAAP